MKGQTTIEFMAVLFVLMAYLSVVFSLFSSAKGSLERAADGKLERRISQWIEFIAARPEGTEIRLELTPYPGRYLGVGCGEPTRLTYPSGSTTVDVASACVPLNITGKSCLSIERVREGVEIEVC